MWREDRERERRKEGSSFKRHQKSHVGITGDVGVPILVCGLDTREAGGCICPWETKHGADGTSKPNQEKQLLEML